MPELTFNVFKQTLTPFTTKDNNKDKRHTLSRHFSSSVGYTVFPHLAHLFMMLILFLKPDSRLTLDDTCSTLPWMTMKADTKSVDDGWKRRVEGKKGNALFLSLKKRWRHKRQTQRHHWDNTMVQCFRDLHTLNQSGHSFEVISIFTW